ncbi:MAG: type II secretion system F family protein [Acidimicrobiales bacterium]
MTALLVGAAVAGWIGSVLVLDQLRWFRRRRLILRLAPYQLDPRRWQTRSAVSLDSLRDVLAPVSTSAGEVLARAFGVTDPLDVRLARIGDRRTVTDFRLHQMAWSAVGFLAAVTLSFVTTVPTTVTAFLALTLPLIIFLVIEQQVTAAAERHRRQVRDELPVVAEQMAMLLQAGFSINSATVRLAQRSSGTIADDLAGVTRRSGQGLTTLEAWREWADLVDVEPLHRVVAICALDHEMGDVGPLMSEEARSIRQQAQRDLIEKIERRNQQVWVPVTVATLVPGVILLAIPFVDALRTFSVGQ